MEQKHDVFFIYSSADGQLSWSHALGIENCVTVQVGLQIAFSFVHFISTGYIPRKGMAGSRVDLFSAVQGVSILSSKVITLIYVPTNRGLGNIIRD